MTAALAAALAAAGCGPYADFRLPEPGPAAAAPLFRWEAAPAPVLPRGGPGEWDARDALNPSVVERGGAWFNFYSGFDGRVWRTGLATSPDGMRWSKVGAVLEPDPASWEGDYIAANGSALWHAGEFLYWYQAGPREQPRLGLARSPDGRRWTRTVRPVLETGPRGSWDERGVADPYVIRTGRQFYLFYLGQDRAQRQRLGIARSRDGVSWEKLRGNPVLEPGAYGSFDEFGLGEPAVWVSQGRYWMLYTGRDASENRRLGVAQSRDGVRWEKLPIVFAGDQAWNAKVICDPSVEPAEGAVRVWFGGGDAASPDENLNGQIGLATLRLVGATLAK
jgi:predicted GH43/DUF377 family glycosyl hydrolase